MGRPKRNDGRRRRTSFGQQRSQLTVDQETRDRISSMKKVPRWVNDDNAGTRLKELFERGYDFMPALGNEIIGDPDGGYMPPESGSHIRRHVGMDKAGQPMYAYLMVTNQENYDDDQGEKESINAQIDTAIKGGDLPGNEKTDPSLGSTYVKSVKYKP